MSSSKSLGSGVDRDEAVLGGTWGPDAPLATGSADPSSAFPGLRAFSVIFQGYHFLQELSIPFIAEVPSAVNE